MFEHTKHDGADDEAVISVSDTSSNGEQPKYGSVADDDGHEKSKASEAIIGDKETKEVRKVKFIIFLVVLMSVLGALAVFFYSKQSEDSRFETTFYSDANKVLQSLERSIETSLIGLNELALTAITVARSTNQTFPFVYIPGFGTHVANLAPTNGATCTYFVPLVTYENRRAWDLFSAKNNTILPTYVNETLQFQENYPFYYGPKGVNNTPMIHDTIYRDDYENPPFSDQPYYNTSRPGLYDIYLPDFQKFPLVMTSYYAANWDWYSRLDPDGMTTMIKNKKATISTPYMVPNPNDQAALTEADLWCEYFKDYIAPGENCMEPLSVFYYPIIANTSIDDVTQFNGVLGMISQEFYWRNLLRDILPPESTGLILVFTNDCANKSFTYQIDGRKAKYLGVGDHHNPKYNDLTTISTMAGLRNFAVDSRYIGVEVDDEYCPYMFQVYPSEQMQSALTTNQGIIFAVSAVAFIVFPFMVFLGYERLISQQQKKLVSSAQRSNAIVESLFPANVRDKLGGDGNNALTPIADLYPDTTVLFADIANFTVWSSVRDPFAVFTLLEAVYSSFDEIATRRSVFKVETIGDCYVAVMGLPVPRRNHAVVMAKFAQEIIQVMRNVVSGLDSRLGPGTSELNIRVGLNSGPTTAGVLRGSKERFQLFGDTVNTAARMENHSSPGKILCTQKTADLIIAAGKEHWIKEIKGLVNAKGKGSMQCYWCKPKLSAQVSVKSNEMGDRTSSTISDEFAIGDRPSENVIRERLVDWMVTLFEDALVKILLTGRKRSSCCNEPAVFTAPRYEVSETIVLVDTNARQKDVAVTDAQVDEVVKAQLHQYITLIAESYRNNAFHNFEHACHVVLATTKLLSRVIKPKESCVSAASYGLTSDPLTHFGILFSAMIHDVDHPGVSNSQLVKENADIAVQYNNQSVAEQNSVTLAWDLLMQSKFDDLRGAIVNDQEDLKRFRQIVVNSVMATDLFDAELRTFRENRWKKAFESSLERDLQDCAERQSSLRAAIVIEHIIQASDVSHTMQHWYVYQKWNKRLFYEMYTAYVSGRAEKDPSIGWYEGEIWFFDHYIIPLAKKLKTCGVFGVSCDELLNYAIDNRDEWMAKGRGIVEQHVASVRRGDVDS